VPTELVEGLTTKNGGKGILKQVPMRKFGEVQDVSGIVNFLASDDSKYMTGALFTVDGGSSAVLGTGAPL
jgi:3-oxoacyl-[acyl-carrier protein] reductase